MWWWCGPAIAGTVTNQNSGVQYATLEEAIGSAAAGDVLLASGTFAEAVHVDKELSIVGDGATLIDATGLGAALTVDFGVTFVGELATWVSDEGALYATGAVVLSDSTVTGGAGSTVGSGSVLERVSFTGANLQLSAGATLTDVTFAGTSTTYVGGGLWVTGGDVVCTRCEFDGNSAVEGAAVYAVTPGTVQLVDSTLTNTLGGSSAVFSYGGRLELVRTTFANLSGYGVIGTGTGSFRNVVVIEPVGYSFLLADGPWELSNADLVGSTVGVSLTGDLSVVNTLVVGAQSDPFLGGTVSYSLADQVVLAGTANLSEDPMWVAGRPLPWSPLIDGGDPAIVDPDGTRSNIGSTGGPDADPALYADDDGDGSPLVTDCDDTDASISAALDLHPDYDADGVPATATVFACPGPGLSPTGDDCDDLDPAVGSPTVTYYPDEDGDGLGSVAGRLECALPEGWVTTGTDCDDTDGAGLEFEFGFVDSDVDGFGVPPQVAQCAGSGLSSRDDDCDDTDGSVFPGAEEVCDGADSNCADGVTDEPVVTVYADADADGFGDPGAPSEACAPGDGTVADASDCDDARAEVSPDGAEVCDGLDNDCSGAADDGVDCADPKPEQGGCGCASTGAPLGWIAAGLVALGARRRRASRGGNRG
ncbi:MAG: putative metal-binding motif-containing protein [Myxococcota bacterium]